MKTKNWIISGVLLLLVALFYGNLYFQGTFNDIEIKTVLSTTHNLQGRWLEGSFSKSKDEEQFFDFQTQLIEKLGQKEVSVIYFINPTKENHNQFKVFMGIECDSNTSLLSKDFTIETFVIPKALTGKQTVKPAYQRVHSKLLDYAEDNKLKLSNDTLFEKFDSENFYVEMWLK